MPGDIVINGKAVATDHEHQHTDASDSDHIIIRTKGDPLNKTQKKELGELGVDIHEFVGNEHQQLYLCAYFKDSLVQIRALNFIEYADIYSQEFVVHDGMEAAKVDSIYANTKMVEVDLLMHRDVEKIDKNLIASISEAADVDQSTISVDSDSGVARVKVNGDFLDNIAALEEVRVIHPVNPRRLFTNVARRLLGSDDAMFNGTAYKGQDQIICVADTGFDTGKRVDVHDAFSGRVNQLYAWGRTKDNMCDDPDGHGTHVCGSILGRGQHTPQGTIEGTAPAASLIVQSMFVRINYENRSLLGGFPKNLGQLFDQGYKDGARIHTNSWGTPLPRTTKQRPYDAGAEGIDRYVWDHQDMAILFAAGNDGQDSGFNGGVKDCSLGAEASAKNCITVGASENDRPGLLLGKKAVPYTYNAFWPNRDIHNPLKDDHQADNPEGLAAFSSRGPTTENRLKPDVVAPGTAILSAKSRRKSFTLARRIDKTNVSDDSRYLYLSGTSMATSLVAGGCAAVRECLLKNGYRDEANGIINPTASLIKALIINGAVPIAGQYMSAHIAQGPNPHSGFGRVNIKNTIAIIEPDITSSGYGIGVIDEETEEPFETEISIPPSSDGNDLTLKLTMAYADLPGASLANDLNLVVVAGDKQRHGNQGDQEFNIDAKQSFDRNNNVEQVVWPQITGDKVKVVVKHFRLMSDHVPFAYAWWFF